MERISKIDTRIQRTAYGPLALLMGLPFFGIGSFFALAGFGVLQLPSKANAPLWVIGGAGIAFAMAGLILIGHSLRGIMYRRHARRIRHRYPDKPWLYDYPWQATGIRDAAGRWFNTLLGVLLMAALLTPFNWWAFLSRDGMIAVQIFTGLFDLLLLLAFCSLLYRLLQHAKYGATYLAFDHFPFVPGKPIRLTLSPNRFEGLVATLRYVEERFEARGHGRNRSISHNSYQHYHETKDIEASPAQTDLVIAFELPDNPEWVTRLTADPSIRYWELMVTCEQPGIDFRTTFPLPVYDCPPSEIITARQPQRSAGRWLWRMPYAFEAGLPLVVMALLGALWLIAPLTFTSGIAALRSTWSSVQAVWLLKPLNVIGTSPMDLTNGPDGRVWALSKYKIVRFAGERQETLLDSQRYRQLFERKVNALSSILVTGADEAWVGSWYGELFHYRTGTWRQLTRREEPLKKRIYALRMHRGDIYLAGGDGLWHWSIEHHDLQPVRDVPPGTVGTLSDHEDMLCSGIGSALWCFDNDAWRLVWEGPSVITALHPRTNGGWMVGTRKGYFLLTQSGDLEGHELNDTHITGFVRQRQRLWVATWKDGLLSRDEAGWKTLKTDSLSTATVDADGVLWMAVYGAGLLRIPIPQAVALLEY